MEVIAAREMNYLYIYLDIAFLILFALLLIKSNRKTALIAGIAGGVLYLLVDYGYFYRILGTRRVSGADPFWFLAWLSMSYGFTNFAWIWLWLDDDGNKLEWSLFIVAGWLCTALLSQSFGQSFPVVSISRGTNAYHGIMALILFAGYGILCVKNILGGEGSAKIPILKILSIGILVQGAWEFVLLITGIRPAGFAALTVNALLETNMGLPYLYFIHGAVKKHLNKPKPPLPNRNAFRKF